jgi:hypothetical protein
MMAVSEPRGVAEMLGGRTAMNRPFRSTYSYLILCGHC